VEVQERRAGSSDHGRALCRRRRSHLTGGVCLPIPLPSPPFPSFCAKSNTQFHLFLQQLLGVHPCPMLGPPP
jgi:hypothetical protein